MNKLALLFCVGLFLIPLGFCDLANGLLAYYHLDELSGTIANLNLGSVGVNGVIDTGTPTLGVPGKIGTAWNFTGSAGVNLSFKHDTLPLSINVWVYSYNNNVDERQIVNNNNGGYDFSLLEYVNNYSYFFGNSYVRTNSIISKYEWVMLTLIIESGNSSLYKNGILVSNNALGVNSNGGYWHISRADYNPGVPATAYYLGTIDELAIWNRAITFDEITKLYNGSYGYTIFGGMNLTAIFDNTTSHIQEFNKSFNILLTGVNATGDVVPQSITIISADAGLSATNITSNVNYSITLTNTSVPNGNYSFFAYDPYNESLNITFYIIINDVNNITYINTSTFFKYNDTKVLNFTMFLDNGNLTCDDYFNLSIAELNISNQLVKSCELVSLIFNNSEVYNYTLNLTNYRFSRLIQNTQNIYTNAYNLSEANYNTTISNNSYTNIYWYLSTINDYNNSGQGINVSIIFNGTTYYQELDGLNYSFSQLLTTNNLVENIPFNIILNLSLGNEYLIFNNSYNLTITLIQLDDCSTYTHRILNISIRNEENVNLLVPNSTLITYFYINNAVIPIKVYNDTDGIIGICMNNTVSFTYDADFIFSAQNYGATDKISREHFFIDAVYNGSTQQQSFYKLITALAAKKTFTLYDYNNRLLEGYIIRISRWYGDSLKTVAEAKTNNNGLALTYARFYDFAYYQVEVLDSSGSIVYTSDINVFSSENNNIYLTAGSVSTYYDLFQGYEFSYSWSNDTQLFSSTISKLDGSDDTYYLRIYSINGSMACYKSNITSSWTTYCNLSDYKGVLIAQAFSVDSTGRVILLYNYYFKNPDGSAYDWGSFGVILTFIIVLLMGVIGVSVYYPITPLLMSMGLLLSVIIDFINISFAAVIGLIFASSIFLLFMMKRAV